ncbi:ABC transporter ATP-binding protein [Bythopirellula polymerisocia]|uniref:P-loop containing nucleoside triphosphate hydrolase n=1 Tax=Bythopirellula polymerisocia TaxID=2528003 RepID=A0A5C6CN36_9BACT|nr:ABC transporter ATP-binding protein [Bythopirellula polymerisocia]TWU25838.1 P-loop containing nucleoside triphosphate hydrolase [Bythopirellula polymerisocia]
MSSITDPRQARPALRLSEGTSALATQPLPARVQIATRQLFKSYQKGSFGIPVLQGIDLEIYEGEFLAIVGSSGCGKSTLLHLLGTLDRPDAGEVHFDGHRIDNLPSASRDILRNKHFGMIFQFYHLLPELTALENVLAPALIAESTLGYWFRRGEHRRRAAELLELVGVSHRMKHKPRELSGGEMQRAAIARALLNKPRVLLADEPTGNLDRSTGKQIMKILGELNQQEKLTIVMVTHDPWIAEQADRTVKLVEGRIQGA